jgi:hypothetical protein
MIELRCSSAALALAIGCNIAGTQEQLEELLAEETVIRVEEASHSWRLYWRWQLGDRAAAPGKTRRGR